MFCSLSPHSPSLSRLLTLTHSQIPVQLIVKSRKPKCILVHQRNTECNLVYNAHWLLVRIYACSTPFNASQTTFRFWTMGKIHVLHLNSNLLPKKPTDITYWINSFLMYHWTVCTPLQEWGDFYCPSISQWRAEVHSWANKGKRMQTLPCLAWVCNEQPVAVKTMGRVRTAKRETTVRNTKTNPRRSESFLGRRGPSIYYSFAVSQFCHCVADQLCRLFSRPCQHDIKPSPPGGFLAFVWIKLNF